MYIGDHLKTLHAQKLLCGYVLGGVLLYKEFLYDNISIGQLICFYFMF